MHVLTKFLHLLVIFAIVNFCRFYVDLNVGIYKFSDLSLYPLSKQFLGPKVDHKKRLFNLDLMKNKGGRRKTRTQFTGFMTYHLFLHLFTKGEPVQTNERATTVTEKCKTHFVAKLHFIVTLSLHLSVWFISAIPQFFFANQGIYLLSVYDMHLVFGISFTTIIKQSIFGMFDQNNEILLVFHLKPLISITSFKIWCWNSVKNKIFKLIFLFSKMVAIQMEKVKTSQKVSFAMQKLVLNLF